MFLNKGPMVDICPIWTVMVIVLVPLPELWRHILVQNQHKCICNQQELEAITVISGLPKI
jgi:hypothetical protein